MAFISLRNIDRFGETEQPLIPLTRAVSGALLSDTLSGECHPRSIPIPALSDGEPIQY
jgi:hypothetical protein